MTTHADQRVCASVAVADLRHLAELRLHSEIAVQIVEDRAWISWNADDTALGMVLTRCVLHREGVEWFTFRDGYWYRRGEHLPVFHVPDGMREPRSASVVSFAQMFAPAVTQFEMPEPCRYEAIPVRMVCDDRCQPQPTTALMAPLVAVLAWADGVPSDHLARFNAAWTMDAVDASGDRAELLIIGGAGTLPLLSAGSRYWGSGVLVPLGFRLVPDLASSALGRLVGATDQEIVLWNEKGYERIDRSVFQPLDRARLALARRNAGWSQAEPRSEEKRAVGAVRIDRP